MLRRVECYAGLRYGGFAEMASDGSALVWLALSADWLHGDYGLNGGLPLTPCLNWLGG